MTRHKITNYQSYAPFAGQRVRLFIDGQLSNVGQLDPFFGRYAIRSDDNQTHICPISPFGDGSIEIELDA